LLKLLRNYKGSMKKSELRQIIKEELLKEGMSKYNSKEGQKYFQMIDDVLVLIQDIKRWLTEAVDMGGVDLADDLLKELKKEISKISQNDY